MQVVLIFFIVACAFGAGWNFGMAYKQNIIVHAYSVIYGKNPELTKKFLTELDKIIVELEEDENEEH